MKAVGFGPYVGDFENEVVTFRPYIKWVSEILEIGDNNLFLFVHENRTFMYDWFNEDNIFRVYKQLTRAETEQYGYVHNNIKQKDFNLLIKIFKENIIKSTGYSKKDIDIIHLPYVKNTPIYSVYEKSFVKIPIPEIDISDKYKDRVIFIPYQEKKEGRTEEIYDFLVNNYDAIIIGDLSINLEWDNIILNNIDYFENGFKYIFKTLYYAKCIICPISFWTYLCNLQYVPVFSYGESPGPYKPGGIYYLNNDKSLVIPTNEESDTMQITRMIEYFMEKML